MSTTSNTQCYYLWVGDVEPELTNEMYDRQLKCKIYWLMSGCETCNNLFTTHKLPALKRAANPNFRNEHIVKKGKRNIGNIDPFSVFMFWEMTDQDQ